MAGAMLAATGGPLGDMATISMTQQLPNNQRGKLNSVIDFLGGIGMTAGLMLSPKLFSTTGGATGIVYAAIAFITFGALGMLLARRDEFNVPEEFLAMEEAAPEAIVA